MLLTPTGALTLRRTRSERATSIAAPHDKSGRARLTPHIERAARQHRTADDGQQATCACSAEELARIRSGRRRIERRVAFGTTAHTDRAARRRDLRKPIIMRRSLKYHHPTRSAEPRAVSLTCPSPFATDLISRRHFSAISSCSHALPCVSMALTQPVIIRYRPIGALSSF